ncbi:hypothetical protein BSKO_09022 [Bryopsis sp. KO-2023]|nr:hypothetical protein BSKO_09022 [Bryopsis sp. KO-2023]
MQRAPLFGTLFLFVPSVLLTFASLSCRLGPNFIIAILSLLSQAVLFISMLTCGKGGAFYRHLGGMTDVIVVIIGTQLLAAHHHFELTDTHATSVACPVFAASAATMNLFLALFDLMVVVLVGIPHGEVAKFLKGLATAFETSEAGEGETAAMINPVMDNGTVQEETKGGAETV